MNFTNQNHDILPNLRQKTEIENFEMFESWEALLAVGLFSTELDVFICISLLPTAFFDFQLHFLLLT